MSYLESNYKQKARKLSYTHSRNGYQSSIININYINVPYELVSVDFKTSCMLHMYLIFTCIYSFVLNV